MLIFKVMITNSAVICNIARHKFSDLEKGICHIAYTEIPSISSNIN